VKTVDYFMKESLRKITPAMVISLLLMPLIFPAPIGSSAYGDATVTSFYSCDSYGLLLDRFPKNSYAYFNVTIESLTNQTLSLSVHLTAEDELHQSIGTDMVDTTLEAGESTFYIMKIFVPSWAFVGVATAYASLWSGGMPIYSGGSTNFRIIPEDTVPPSIQMLSPYNLTYQIDSVLLAFNISERTSWTGYSINDAPNVTISGNTTLRNLQNGSYKIAVSANDTSGNMNTSEHVWFAIQVQHDVSLVSLEGSPSEVFKGEVVNIALEVENQGSMPESFNTTLYANSTALQEWETLNLEEDGVRILEFQWNTSNLESGDYTLSADISPVVGETDLADNNLANGTVTVLLRHETTVTGATLSKTVLGRGYPLTVDVTIRNRSDLDENLSLSVYANESVISTSSIFLVNQSETTVKIEWNDSSFPTGNYSIVAFVPPFPDEINVTDNRLQAGSVLITVAGDVTSEAGVPDGKVDMRDIGTIATLFGKTPFSLEWDPNVDLNSDLRIDLRDIGIACNNFGKLI
jgi:hypothetical protein